MLLSLTTVLLSLSGAFAAADDTEPTNRLLVSLITESELLSSYDFWLAPHYSCRSNLNLIRTLVASIKLIPQPSLCDSSVSTIANKLVSGKPSINPI